jgi:hypothetical protein
MGLARIVLGGEIDVCTGEEMEKVKGDLLGAIDKNKPSDKRFILRPFFGSGVVPASGPLQIDLNPVGPAVGRIWNIVRLTTLVDDHTAQAGVTVAWYKGDNVNVSLSQCFQPAMSVPSTLAMSKDIEWQTIDERLFALVYGATAGANVTLAGIARDYSSRDVIQTMI